MYRRHFAQLCGALLITLASLAQPAAADEIVLTIDGNVTGGSVTFTDAQLLELPQIAFDTGTIWTESVQNFSGPSLAAVLAAAGAQGTTLTLRAINDYVVEVPMTLIEDAAPIVANRIDGQAFSLRDKGPLWIVFPYDSDARYRAESVYAFSVWQLSGITVN